MNYSSLTRRIAGESVDNWAVHYEAMARRFAGQDIILLSVGQESDELTPEPVREAAVDSIRGGRHHYTPVVGEEALREAIARRHLSRTEQVVNAANVTVFSGAQNALFGTAQCLLEHDCEVIVPEPYYATYPATFTAPGSTMVTLPTREEHGFQIDPDTVVAAMTARTRAVVLNSPNNPTGAVYSRERLQAVVDACRARNIWIISDEVYAELTPSAHYTRVCSLPGAAPITVTVGSLSKSHRMTGWRCGWTVAPVELTEHFYNLNMCMCYGLPAFTQDAALRALEEDIDLTATLRNMLDRRRALVTRELAELQGAKLRSSGGGMFVVLDIRPLAVPATEFAWKMLDEHGVGILPCDGFGESGRGLLRISLCENDDRLALACDRLRVQIEHYFTQR